MSSILSFLSTKKCFQDLQFVLKSTSNNSIKPVFTKVYVDIDGDITKVMCTDGKRLHLVEWDSSIMPTAIKIESGLYDVIKKTGHEILFLEYHDLTFVTSILN